MKAEWQTHEPERNQPEEPTQPVAHVPIVSLSGKEGVEDKKHCGQEDRQGGKVLEWIDRPLQQQDQANCCEYRNGRQEKIP